MVAISAAGWTRLPTVNFVRGSNIRITIFKPWGKGVDVCIVTRKRVLVHLWGSRPVEFVDLSEIGQRLHDGLHLNQQPPDSVHKLVEYCRVVIGLAMLDVGLKRG
ncbi:hypothetical protein PC111_g15002 [Phytophthora cactorum]|uniref:Uncharacterized protein n=1 Tax=Phytophthora cactorum TaxID=29920 RepID=A0A8T1BL58_9STRA|nr:hypothetical protein PC111_g15002 [Phytophthora cactorum]KAG2905487.1 hypothetical protein PC115_g14597 [Phytophthora cactorum]KAG3072447.1 hypothetical protein PC122_g15253 [Phytophthora cactorum]KAG4049202.1 hypothetical protein PC123_g15511 [Phytophthora cactorum]